MFRNNLRLENVLVIGYVIDNSFGVGKDQHRGNSIVDILVLRERSDSSIRLQERDIRRNKSRAKVREVLEFCPAPDEGEPTASEEHRDHSQGNRQ